MNLIKPLFSDDPTLRNLLRSPVPTTSSVLKNAQPSPPWPNAVHISPKDGEGHVVKQTVARYPFEAKNMHVTGTVVLRILISQTGDVKDMLLVEGDRRLVPACGDAVKRWKYKPFVRDGEPVEVDMATQCHFDMSGG